MVVARRLQALDPFIPRARLLDRLPDGDGFVLWLHAPYGYGKSVLLGQWAEALEVFGRRVIWFSAEEGAFRRGLADQLGLPPTAPWPVLLDELNLSPTLLVVEEADHAGDELDRVLRDFGGLVGLASRAEIASAELPRLLTQRRLTRLAASDLAFTLSESEQLQAYLTDSPRAAFPLEELWRRAEGWPLPLHLALLSGGAPSMHSIVRGISSGLDEDLRAELRLLAAVAELPAELVTAKTRALVAQGMAQELASAVRLHPLVSEALQAVEAAEVAAELRAQAERLPWPLRVASYARLGLLDDLALALEDREQLGQAGSDPERWLAWHAAAPGGGSLWRRLGSCMARFGLTQVEAALGEMHPLLEDEGLEPRWRLRLIQTALLTLGRARRLEEAQPLAEVAEGFVARWPFEADLPPLRHALALLKMQRGELEEAERMLAELVGAGVASADRPALPVPSIARLNLLLVRLELSGDHLAYLAELRAVRELVGAEADRAFLLTYHHNMAINHVAVGDLDSARAAYAEALGQSDLHARLFVRMGQAYVDRDLSRFPELFSESRRWEYDLIIDRVAALWLRTCRALDQVEEARRVEGMLPEVPYVLIERAWLAHRLGEGERATGLLQQALELRQQDKSIINRDFWQQWRAVDFIVHGGAERLGALLALTPHPAESLVSWLVPLSSLPQDRPELAACYPLAEVLASGWREAIQLRLPEVPPLELRLLGGFGVRLLGQELTLTARQQQLLTLIAIGQPRSRWGEQLWPEADPSSSENNLRVQLHQLKRLLEPWGEPTYLVGDVLVHNSSDYGRLGQALADGDAEAVWREWTGELTPDLGLDAIQLERRSLEREAVELLGRAAAVAPPETAVRYLEKALAIEPIHEDLLSDLLRHLRGLGRHGTARRRLREFSEQLVAETGEPPSEATLRSLEG